MDTNFDISPAPIIMLSINIKRDAAVSTGEGKTAGAAVVGWSVHGVT